MKNNIGKYLVLLLGGFTIVGLLTIGVPAAIRSINGLAVAQSNTKWNNLKDAAFGDNATSGIMAMNPYLFDGINFDRARGDATNGLDVDITRMNDGGNSITVDGTVGVTGNVSTVGSITPSDAFANPTTSTTPFSLMGIWNGTTWDRTRHSFVQATTTITTNAAGATVAMSTTPMSKYTMVIDRTVGATDVVEVDLECSIDGTIFIQIGTVVSLAGEPTITPIDGTPCTDIRYNVVTVGAGNTLTIQLLAIR